MKPRPKITRESFQGTGRSRQVQDAGIRPRRYGWIVWRRAHRISPKGFPDVKAKNADLEHDFSTLQHERLGMSDRFAHFERVKAQAKQRELEIVTKMQGKFMVIGEADLARDKAVLLEQQTRKEVEKLNERIVLAFERYKEIIMAETER
ncbi:hypothetical protein PsorP6_007617 [Peronosclerospora sorghi]|uniref:Uncharacterized protein n=1 Tax=Peronosclerospora sorghi TaxID=230839 RepID=A0ACC0WCA0_9STRA|nr:hypothetical protein PsorP6_007617 [Peronosclerospora sorghi]